jgi:hypothetical protein
VDTTNELDALGLPDNAVKDLKELVWSARWKFLETLCCFWVRGKSSSALCGCFRQGMGAENGGVDIQKTPRYSTDLNPGRATTMSQTRRTAYGDSKLCKGV